MAEHFFARRKFMERSAALSMLLGFGLHGVGRAQPRTGQLRVICSGPAGSIPDIVARRIAEQMTADFPGGVLVDNRPGAAGQIAVNALRQAPADGSTALLAQGAIATVYPYLYSKLAYNPEVDLKPVSMAAEATLALAVGPTVPNSIGNLREFIDWTRQNPKLANFGSPGIGTLPHLLGAALFHEAKVNFQHIVYAGGPPAIGGLLGGHISSLILPEGLFRQHRVAGKLRVLATSGQTHSEYFPDVASFAEQGHRELVMREWFAFFMPGQTSAAHVDLVANSVRKAVAKPQLVAAFGDAGMGAVSSTPSALDAKIIAEQKYWQKVLQSTGIRAE